MKQEIKQLLKNKYFYIGLVIFILGVSINIRSQKYLFNCISNGEELPVLHDLILDNIPYMNVFYVSDYLVFGTIILFLVWIFHTRKYNEMPYYLAVFGATLLIRGIFIAITPLGNPLNFQGDSIFHAFSKYKLGTFPSGHTGAAFMAFLLADKSYKYLFLFSTVGIIITLLLSRGHYSIDILGGIFFAYAIYSFSEKYLKKRLIK